MNAYFLRNGSVVMLGVRVLFAATWARADSCVGPTAVAASNENWSVDG